MFHHSLTSAAVISRQLDKGISLLKIATGVICAASDEVRPFRHPHTIPERVRIHPRESAIKVHGLSTFTNWGKKHDRA